MKDLPIYSETRLKTKLIIADDHRIVRKSIVMLLSGTENIEIVGEVSNGKELLALLETTLVDIILMDISMPEMNGIEATAIVNNIKPWIRVIGLSIHTHALFIKKMLAAGAYGYVVKNSSGSEIFTAIDKVRKNQKYLCPQAMASLTNDLTLQDDEMLHTPKISLKELEIIRLIAEGRCNNDIASRMFVSVKTIERHKTNLFKKLNLTSSASLVNYAVRNNLLIK